MGKHELYFYNFAVETDNHRVISQLYADNHEF